MAKDRSWEFYLFALAPLWLPDSSVPPSSQRPPKVGNSLISFPASEVSFITAFSIYTTALHSSVNPSLALDTR